MNFGNDEGGKIDPITRARMEQAGLHVPDGLTKEKRLWHRALNRETRCREVANELLVHQELSVADAFARAEEFVDLALSRFEAVQETEPTGNATANVVTS